MMIYYKVLLPKRLWRQHRNNLNHFQTAVYHYMKSYPHYNVVGVSEGFIICKRKGALI
jgi:hypothetical protein